MNVQHLSNDCYLPACHDRKFSFPGLPLPRWLVYKVSRRKREPLVRLYGSHQQNRWKLFPNYPTSSPSQHSSFTWLFKMLSFGSSYLIHRPLQPLPHLTQMLVSIFRYFATTGQEHACQEL